MFLCPLWNEQDVCYNFYGRGREGGEGIGEEKEEEILQRLKDTLSSDK